MKTVMLIRHGKSSWKNAELEDVDRPLNARGKQNATMMGKRLAKQDLFPDLFVSSSAKRAMDTAKIIGYEVSYTVENIVVEPFLYLASADDIFQWLQQRNDRCSHVWIVGHNPVLTELAQKLCNNGEIENLPTCAFYRAEFDVAAWADITIGKGRELAFDYPESLS